MGRRPGRPRGGAPMRDQDPPSLPLGAPPGGLEMRAEIRGPTASASAGAARGYHTWFGAFHAAQTSWGCSQAMTRSKTSNWSSRIHFRARVSSTEKFCGRHFLQTRTDPARLRHVDFRLRLRPTTETDYTQPAPAAAYAAPEPTLAPRPPPPRPRPRDRLLVDNFNKRPTPFHVHVLLVERRLQNDLAVAPHVRPRVVLRRPLNILEI